KIRSLVLDSPLPTFVPIDEDEPANFIEAINVLSKHCGKDSSNQERYGNLKTQFETYFNSIADKKFYFPYLEKGTSATRQIEYTKNELLDIIYNKLQDPSALREVPFLITEMINGNHAPYIQKKLDDIFNRNIAPSGMRMLVYCADQANYHSEEVILQFWEQYPFMEGYRINDVYNAVCDCWRVPPISIQTKQPFYSKKPVLIGDGEMDPACSPLYMSMIRHYMPNAQCFLFINRSHGVGGKEFHQMVQRFLDDPYKRIESPGDKIIAYY
ncbi:MAG TPA: alpha/beta hydrolase, partial [Chitinophagaceae bacterium]